MVDQKTAVLIILDGWGLAPPGKGNAVDAANTPIFDQIWNSCPHTTLQASGEAVGLPEGQMGNSEVGHTNLGAGRVVYQLSTRISKAIRDGDFFDNEVLVKTMRRARSSRLHLLGLVSDGGVHSQLEHLLALLELAKRQNVQQVYIHAFMDGRDTSPTAGAGYLDIVQTRLDQLQFETGCIATLMGRYWAMDRDKRWERTERVFRALRHTEGEIAAESASETVQACYRDGETDEFIKPRILNSEGAINDGDVALFFNFRPDRARQLSHAFADETFEAFNRGNKPNVYFIGMRQYETNLQMPVAFPPARRPKEILGEVISNVGLKQFRCAETEKYAHVTYFFNNGREKSFLREDRKLIPSPKVSTYDLQPEMSASEVATETAKRIRSNKYAFVLVNFANPDMVGHTGVIDAAVKAVEATDSVLGEVLTAVKDVDGTALVVADHGNAECMLHQDGSPHTAHTTNLVPCVYVGDQQLEFLGEGKLCDVAPTILHLLGIPQPEEMSGKCLVKR